MDRHLRPEWLVLSSRSTSTCGAGPAGPVVASGNDWPVGDVAAAGGGGPASCAMQAGVQAFDLAGIHVLTVQSSALPARGTEGKAEPNRPLCRRRRCRRGSPSRTSPMVKVCGPSSPSLPALICVDGGLRRGRHARARRASAPRPSPNRFPPALMSNSHVICGARQPALCGAVRWGGQAAPRGFIAGARPAHLRGLSRGVVEPSLPTPAPSSTASRAPALALASSAWRAASNLRASGRSGQAERGLVRYAAEPGWLGRLAGERAAWQLAEKAVAGGAGSARAAERRADRGDPKPSSHVGGARTWRPPAPPPTRGPARCGTAASPGRGCSGAGAPAGPPASRCRLRPPSTGDLI